MFKCRRSQGHSSSTDIVGDLEPQVFHEGHCMMSRALRLSRVLWETSLVSEQSRSGLARRNPREEGASSFDSASARTGGTRDVGNDGIRHVTVDRGPNSKPEEKGETNEAGAPPPNRVGTREQGIGGVHASTMLRRTKWLVAANLDVDVGGDDVNQSTEKYCTTPLEKTWLGDDTATPSSWTTASRGEFAKIFERNR